MNPYGYVAHVVTYDAFSPYPQELLTWWVAGGHTLTQSRCRGWWQLCNVALSIWLTRRWSTEELASAAYAVAIKWPPRKPRAVSPEP